MIQIKKGPLPQVLADHAATWTAEYLKHHNAGTDPPVALKNRYKEPEVKAAILKETHEKCAYCESKITANYPGDVEHILPKSEVPQSYVQWDNLTLGCFNCNNAKRAYYAPAEPLIDPVKDDPKTELRFAGPLCVHLNPDSNGLRTKIRLQLNRQKLFGRRIERLEKITTLRDLVASAKGPVTRQMLLDELRQEALPDREFSAMVHDFLIGENLI